MRFTRQRIAPWSFVLLFWFTYAVASRAATDSISSVADGELHACHLVNVDQAWAVGNNGLILATKDAGKQWEVQQPRSNMAFYAVRFENELVGYVAGGSIDPYSHRTLGAFLRTEDGGQTWQPTVDSLPRILGMQLLGPNHILAWGDWSAYYQSALLESTDGGQTWAARPTPCTHIQCAATNADGMLMLVDRTGKVFRSRTGLECEPVDLPITPFDPIRFCKCIDGVWWIGGEAGHLYRSEDTKRWTSVELPGTSADRALYCLNDIDGAEGRVWLVGQPGHVVWHSKDQGNSWTVQLNNNRYINHGISVLNKDVMLTCGSLASLQISRNGGMAWSARHQSGTRNAVLNIASTSSSVAWDLLSHVTSEFQRNASVLVVHDQGFEERGSYQPELGPRIEAAGQSIGICRASVLSGFPASQLAHGVRESDLGYYANHATDSALTSLERRLVLELRCARPDAVVTNCNETGNALEYQTARAVERAIAFSSRKDVPLFSASSGIPNEVWQPQRVLVRGSRPGLQYSDPMLFKQSNVILGNAIANAKAYVQWPPSDSETHFSYRIANSKSGGLREPLDGVLLDPATQRVERIRNNPRLNLLVATCQWFDWKQMLDNEFGNPLIPDRTWEERLRASAKAAMPESLSPVLLEIAIHCRRTGNWNRWLAALELLLEHDSTSPAAEAALWELMQNTGSAEVHCLIAQQLQALEHRTSLDESTATTTLQQASPFARNQRDGSVVQPASYAHVARRIPISTKKDLAEFSRLLSKWPDSFQGRRIEPRWGWLIASRYRFMQLRNDGTVPNLNMQRHHSLYWPSLSPDIESWRQVAAAERALTVDYVTKPTDVADPNALAPSANSLKRLPWTTQRPYLDGKANEDFWNQAVRLNLRDPWSRTANQTTQILIARDAEFLYVYSRAPHFLQQPNTNKSKQRDGLSLDSDHIKLRIDLDRDYATWFELGWSSTGETWDAVNDMPYWNPTWYVANTSDDQAWTSEIAIPLEELFGKADDKVLNCLQEAWAVQAHRSVASHSSHSLAPVLSDQPAIDHWVLLQPK